MARIAGVDIPKQKRGIIALTYIFGIGKSRAKDILAKAQVSEDKKVQDWNDDEIGAIRDAVSYYKIEGELRSEVQASFPCPAPRATCYRLPGWHGHNPGCSPSRGPAWSRKFPCCLSTLSRESHS